MHSQNSQFDGLNIKSKLTSSINTISNSTIYFSKAIIIMQFFILAVSLFASTALVSVTSAAPNGGLRGSIDQTQTRRSLRDKTNAVEKSEGKTSYTDIGKQVNAEDISFSDESAGSTLYGWSKSASGWQQWLGRFTPFSLFTNDNNAV